jgi:hypothetical protein
MEADEAFGVGSLPFCWQISLRFCDRWVAYRWSGGHHCLSAQPIGGIICMHAVIAYQRLKALPYDSVALSHWPKPGMSGDKLSTLAQADSPSLINLAIGRNYSASRSTLSPTPSQESRLGGGWMHGPARHTRVHTSSLGQVETIGRLCHHVDYHSPKHHPHMLTCHSLLEDFVRMEFRRMACTSTS